MSAYRRAATFRGDAAVRTWLRRIVVNACIDRIRHERVRPTEPWPERDLPSRRPEPAVEVATRMAVGEALAKVPVEQRLAVVLVDVQGYPVAEARRDPGGAGGHGEEPVRTGAGPARGAARVPEGGELMTQRASDPDDPDDVADLAALDAELPDAARAAARRRAAGRTRGRRRCSMPWRRPAPSWPPSPSPRCLPRLPRGGRRRWRPNATAPGRPEVPWRSRRRRRGGGAGSGRASWSPCPPLPPSSQRSCWARPVPHRPCSPSAGSTSSPSRPRRSASSTSAISSIPPAGRPACAPSCPTPPANGCSVAAAWCSTAAQECSSCSPRVRAAQLHVVTVDPGCGPAGGTLLAQVTVA